MPGLSKHGRKEWSKAAFWQGSIHHLKTRPLGSAKAKGSLVAYWQSYQIVQNCKTYHCRQHCQICQHHGRREKIQINGGYRIKLSSGFLALSSKIWID